MENAIRPSHIRTKFVYFLVKWEEMITFLTVLCGVSVIGLGLVWFVLRENVILYIDLGLSSFYFIGRKFWKFRDDLI